MREVKPMNLPPSLAWVSISILAQIVTTPNLRAEDQDTVMPESASVPMAKEGFEFPSESSQKPASWLGVPRQSPPLSTRQAKKIQQLSSPIKRLTNGTKKLWSETFRVLGFANFSNRNDDRKQRQTAPQSAWKWGRLLDVKQQENGPRTITEWMSQDRP